jgi:hypothetical protein
MSVRWWHILLLIVVGIGIDYFFPALANMSLGKLTARKT